MSGGEYKPVYRSRDGKVEISTNIPGFKWPTRAEKIEGLLSAGLIDEAEATRLRALGSETATDAAKREGKA